MAVAPVPTPESHPKVRFAAICCFSLCCFSNVRQHSSSAVASAAPLCFPPNTAQPHTGQLRLVFCFPPNMVVAGAAPPRSLRRVSAVSLLLQGTAAPLLQVLPRFASPNTAQPHTCLIYFCHLT
jgi:hypothetical protein